MCSSDLSSRGRDTGWLLQIEERLACEPQIKEEFAETMKNSLAKNSLVKIPKTDEQDKYMPHNLVVKDNNSIQEIRVKTTSNKSLNDIQHAEPRIIYLRWRKLNVEIISDIKQMYTQIMCHQLNQKNMKIEWKYSSKDPVQDYCTSQVTFGSRPAPELAIKTLETLADNEKDKYSPTATSAKENVDYLLKIDNIISTIQLDHKLYQFVASGKFQLLKWAGKFPDANQLHSIEIKVLGVQWSPRTDEFYFKKNLQTISNSTEKEILSTIASTWDPAGILMSIQTVTKLHIQEFWKLSNLGWHEVISRELLQR